jgi:hypothetical protein
MTKGIVMVRHDIDFSVLQPHGHAVVSIVDGTLKMTTTRRLSTDFSKLERSLDSDISVPGLYRLPLRIDLSVKIDSPALILCFGAGHISFGTHFSDNRQLDDIAEPTCKPRFFLNHMPMNEFAVISVIYGLHAMQILINGKERFYSEKERYMKSKLLADLNNKGFAIKVACTKHTNLTLKMLAVTEYDNDPELLHSDTELPKPQTSNPAILAGQKPNFENCIALLSDDIRDEVIKTDGFLRTMKPMRFKRLIEKNGNKITYLASEQGFSYSIYPSGDVMYHSLNWYIITNGKPELWHRRADGMEATLNRLLEVSPDLAERMYENLSECIACIEGCTVRTLYALDDKKKLTCHGRLQLKMCVSDFEDVRAFINTVNQLESEGITPKEEEMI